MIWLLWDLGAVVILAWCIWLCARRGLIRTLISFFSYVIAAVVARMLSLPMARLLYDNIVRGILHNVITQSVQEALADGISLFESVPEALLRMASDVLGTDIAQFDVLQLDTGVVVDAVIDSALRDPVMLLLQSFSFLILFSVALVLLRWVSRLFGGIYRIPVVGTVNTLFGGVLGIFQGVVSLLIGSVIIHFLLVLGGGQWWWLNGGVMEQTFIWRFFLKMTNFFA